MSQGGGAGMSESTPGRRVSSGGEAPPKRPRTHTSPRTQAFSAAALRTVPGLLLPALGLPWAFGEWGRLTWLLLVPAAVVGLAKAAMLWRGSARSLVRLRERGHNFFLGFMSPAMWVLVAAMMTIGIELRRSSIDHGWLGLAYLAIGVGLVVSSVPLWHGAITCVGLCDETVEDGPDAG